MATKHTHTAQQPTLRDTFIKVASGIAVLALAFSLGIKTSHDIKPIHLTNADSVSVPGDLDGNGVVTKDDAVRALEIALGYEQATDRDRAADPNGDLQITVEDALTILKSIR